jgi:hypothetical protein
VEEIDSDERARDRMAVIREFIESKSPKSEMSAGKN